VQSLLFLAHRLPYPPNKGDKVRSCHFLKHLAGRYRVFLGAFIDDPADGQHVESVRRLCAGTHLETIAPWPRRARSATALLRGEPLTLPYFRSRALQQWVRRVVREERVSHALAYSSPMAQYVLDLPLRSIVDFVDMDSAKWGEYAARRGWPARALYRREARRLLAYEKAVAARAQTSIFVTEEETQRFIAEAPQCAGRVVTIRNGVDSDYFSPTGSWANPFQPGERPIVFTGAMDYWPNVDAVVWFAREVLPLLRRRDPAVRFYVVGMNPDGAVRALASDAAIVVTSRVPDVRPYLRHARVVVAPLRVARGIQNKVLEAMAMGKAVVTTPACAAAIAARAGKELAIASDAESFACEVRALMDPVAAGQMGGFARERVLASYGWPASFARLEQLLAQPQAAAVQAVAG
jgi:sugar transferase (PEP-CTERM/EpsH1 system associated)